MRVTRSSSMAFGWRVALWCGLLAWGITLCMGNPPLWQVGAAVLIVGLAIVNGVYLQHQTLHNTGFRSRHANEFWGVILGIPALVSFYDYRVAHLFHHAQLGKPVHFQLYDRRLKLQSGKPKGAQGFLLWHYVKVFIPHLRLVLRGQPIEHHVYRYSQVQQRQFKRFYLIGVGFIALLGALSLALGTWLPLAVWLAALILVAAPVHAVFEFPEHVGCDEFSTVVIKNTRSIESNFFLQWLTHYNNRHAEHHLEPQAPFHLLPGVHPRIADALEEGNSGYVDFYIDYFRRIRPMIRRRAAQMRQQ